MTTTQTYEDRKSANEAVAPNVHPRGMFQATDGHRYSVVKAEAHTMSNGSVHWAVYTDGAGVWIVGPRGRAERVS